MSAWPPVTRSGYWLLATLPIYLAEHDVERADDRDHVGDEVADAHLPQGLQVDEARRPDAHTVRSARAVRHEVTTYLALRPLNRAVVVARGRLDHLRDFGADGAVRQLLQSLLDDAPRLSHLFESDEVSVVRVAVLAHGNLEVHVGVGRVWTAFAYVPRDAGASERRAGKTNRNRILRRDDADADGSTEPDAVLRQKRLVLFQALREIVYEALHVFSKTLVCVVRHAADAPSVARQASAELLLENLQNLLALAQGPKQNGERADVESVRREPEEVRGDAVQLRQDGSYVVGARRDFEAEHLLDRLDPHQPVRDSRDVVEPVPVRRDHRVQTVLRDLLHAAVQEPYVAVEVNDGLAVEPQDDAQDAVRRGVLRPHVQDHFGVVEQRLLRCRDFYLVHKFVNRKW